MSRSTKRYQVAIYLDSMVFGGHEVTLLEAIRALSEEPKIDLLLLVPQANTSLLTRLEEEEWKNNVSIQQHDLQTAPGDVFRVLFRTGKVRQLAAMIRQAQPDLMIVSQGAIALSACGLGAARLAGVSLMSFLPMAHPVALVRGKNSLPVRIQEFLYQQLYALPDYFFTIYNTAKEHLQSLYRVDPEKIFVHYFGLDSQSLQQPALSERASLKQTATKHLALIGRIEFQQKRHDFFMRHLAACRAEMTQINVHIIGDGPDRKELEELVQDLELQGIICFEGWVDDMAAWYEKLDMLLLPSRFEGVPVVMLEAMHWKIPIIASNCDGMAEMLPEEWLFPLNDGEKMILCIKDTLENDQERQLVQNQQRVAELDTASFRTGFLDAVLTCLERERL